MTEPGPSLPAGAQSVSRGGFNLFAGPFWQLSVDDDGMGARYGFVALAKHMNSAGSLHGGLLMTFADVAMSRTARLVASVEACNTVSLTADFVGPGKLGELIEAQVRITRRTRSVIFQSATITAGERVLMTATGLWKID